MFLLFRDAYKRDLTIELYKLTHSTAGLLYLIMEQNKTLRYIFKAFVNVSINLWYSLTHSTSGLLYRIMEQNKTLRYIFKAFVNLSNKALYSLATQCFCLCLMTVESNSLHISVLIIFSLTTFVQI